jgi:membrane dipeptidase
VFIRTYPEQPPRAHLSDVVAHCEHVREVAGIDHIGIGGDFDGVTTLPEGLGDVSAYPALLEALRDRHWSDDDLQRLGHRNITRTFAEAERVAAALRRERGPSLATIEELDGMPQAVPG